jgi:transglutaminase-like putative cysteine protease
VSATHTRGRGTRARDASPRGTRARDAGARGQEASPRGNRGLGADPQGTRAQPAQAARGNRRTAAIAAAAVLLAGAAELPLLRVFGSPGLRIVLLAVPAATLVAGGVRMAVDRALPAPGGDHGVGSSSSSPLAVAGGFVAGLAAGALPGMMTAAPDPFGPSSLSARLEQALTDGWYRLFSVPVPVPYTRSFTDLPFLLAAALAAIIMLAALSKHPAAAVLPAVAGFGGLLVLGADGPVTGTALSGGFALAALIFLVVAAPPAGKRAVTGALTGGALIAGTVLVVGAVHPGQPYNPRASIRLPLDIRVSQDPMAMLSALLQTPRVPVLTARLSGALLAQPRNWVLLTYDTYDGAGWAAPGDAKPAVTAGKAPDAIGTGTASVVAASPLTLLPHPASVLASSPADLEYAPDSELLAAPGPVRAYTVRVSVGIPSVTQLDGAALPTGVPPVLTSVPACVPSALRTLAQDIAAATTVPDEQLLRLQQYLSSAPFSYDHAAAPGEGCASINNMLADRKGTSAQFATAFALAARLLGIPARVAVGYLPGTVSGGVDTVTDADAYAWPQVELTGIGWVDFDPTPKSTANGHQPPREKQPAIPQLQTSAPKTGPIAAPSVQPPPPPSGLSTTARVLLGAGGGVALVLLWVLAVWLWGARRRTRLRRLPDPAARVLGAWDELLVPLAQAGVPIRGRSAQAVAADAARAVPGAARGVRELATLAERALYDQTTADDAGVAWGLSDDARRPALAAAGRWVRLRRPFVPSLHRGVR